jgi:hypothetical protein
VDIRIKPGQPPAYLRRAPMWLVLLASHDQHLDLDRQTDWHAGKVAASGRSIRPTRLTQGGPRYSQKHRACAFAVIGHAAAALKRPMISRRRIAVPKLDRASVTVRTWGLEGGRGLFETEFSFGSAFPPWVKGRRGRQADGTAGLPSAPEIAGVLRHLRFVPTRDNGRSERTSLILAAQDGCF